MVVFLVSRGSKADGLVPCMLSSERTKRLSVGLLASCRFGRVFSAVQCITYLGQDKPKIRRGLLYRLGYVLRSKVFLLMCNQHIFPAGEGLLIFYATRDAVVFDYQRQQSPRWC